MGGGGGGGRGGGGSLLDFFLGGWNEVIFGWSGRLSLNPPNRELCPTYI